MPTLYRKYRPQSFSEVTGQDIIVQTLQNEISLNRLAHAYLLSGPRGVGKTTLARLFAKAISCEKRKEGKSEPCNDCPACNQINHGHHIDIIEIDAASQTGVDSVRENIIENANVLPTILKYKIFIIDEVHMLSTSAFNALLKTLEEPPAHVIFILATTELHKLPATVISRCERYAFKKIAFDKMLERLKNICKMEKVKVDKEVLEKIAYKSEGGLRDAESLLGQILSLNIKEISVKEAQIVLPLSSSETVIHYLKSIVENNPGAAITSINEQAEEGVNLDQFAFELLEALRAMLLILMNAGKDTVKNEYSDEAVKEMRTLATTLQSNKLVALMDLVLKRRAEIKFAPLPQLPLELLAVEAAEMISYNTSQPEQPINATAETKEKLTEKLTIKKEPSTVKVVAGSARTTFEQIQNRWSELVKNASIMVPSLGFILSMCSLKEINGNILTLTVPYQLHKEKLESAKNKTAIEQCLEAIFSEKIGLAYAIVPPKTTEQVEVDVTKLAAEFGGEVI